MSEISKYFGEHGAFATACDLYVRRYHLPLPADVLLSADNRGAGRLAFLLGWCFAEALKQLSMDITREQVVQIAERKITSVSPFYFVDGWAWHKIREEINEAPKP